MARLLVVGGGAAGMAAASRARRLKKDLEVVVVERTRWVSFALCGMPYYLGCVVKRLSDLTYYPLSEFTEERGIKVLLETEVVDIDYSGRKAVIRDVKNGGEKEIEWDYLLLATGARSKAHKFFPEIKEASNIFVLSHLDVAEEARRYALSLGHGARAVIVGSGYVGLEVAENLASLGFKVSIVEALGQVAPRVLDPEFASEIKEHLEEKGVEVLTNAPVKGFKIVDGKAVAVETEKGNIEGDIFIVGVGIEPNADLARRIGVKIGETGAICVDEHMRTSLRDVYAAGDAVEHTDLVSGKRVWRPFAQIANKMGYVAGSNIAGREAVFPGSVGTSTFKVFDLVVARTGLSEEEAKEAGFKPFSVSLQGGTRAHYIPGQVPIKLKVVADEDTGRLLGAQAIGASETVLWRINVVAALLTTGATVWDLFYTDIGYAPPLAPVWDPLITAARLLMRKLGEKPRKA